MTTVPDVDYGATSKRPEWTSLPAAVRAEVSRLAGSPVVRAEPVVTSGFTGSYAGSVQCADGSRLFVKAGGPDTPFVVSALTQEARVLQALPRGIPAPALMGAGECDGWSILVLGLVDGRMPGQPWTPDDAEAAHRTCRTVAELTTPCPDTLRRQSVATSMASDETVLGAGGAMAQRQFEAPAGMPGWLEARQPEIAALVHGAGATWTKTRSRTATSARTTCSSTLQGRIGSSTGTGSGWGLPGSTWSACCR